MRRVHDQPAPAARTGGQRAAAACNSATSWRPRRDHALRRASPGIARSHVGRPTSVYVPRRGRGRFVEPLTSARWSRAAAWRWALGDAVRASDLVHLHGNGFIIEVGRFLARRYRKPYVITLYGTDVWHHDAARHARFARVVRGAADRVFYSQGLLDFARTSGPGARAVERHLRAGAVDVSRARSRTPATRSAATSESATRRCCSR